LKKEAARCRRALALVRRELARRRKIESTLRETISELEAFSYSMSHDMRAPLRTMRSFSQILIHDYASQIDAVGLDHLNRIARAAARLDLLIEDVLNYSRTAREKLDRSRIDLAPLIQEIISERPNLSVHARCIHIPGSLQPVLAHRAALTQCITNLLENAIKFVKPGRAPNIKIFTRKTPGRVLLCIQDFGIGIPRDAQKRIFGLFQGLRHAPDFMSAGVGLTIVRKITERMGGRCGVKSQRGKGSLFWIDLPAGG
jgi:signal transduction histidine kinase